MQLVILASGRGSRLGSQTKLKPKCLVKINGQSLIDYNLEFFDKFKKRIIITGYKSNLIKKKFKNDNFQFIKNKKYSSTNMVYSLFCAAKLVKESIVVCYSDIIFDKNIFKKLTKNTTSIVVKNNWYEYWKKRMKKRDIVDDAENLIIKKKYVQSIGGKINKNMPKNQFMGLIKISQKDFFSLQKFFIKINNKKIDFTSFLNLAIQNKIIKLKAFETNAFWLEIDSIKDLRVAEKLL
jgi:L-glutamine-phosphate cytidylyltransferase